MSGEELLSQVVKQKWFAGVATFLFLTMGGLNIWFIQHFIDSLEVNTKHLINAVEANTRQNFELTTDVRVLQTQVKMIMGGGKMHQHRREPISDEEG